MKNTGTVLMKIFAAIILLAILGLCFWDKPSQLALNFISQTLEEAGGSLLLLTELKIAASSGASVKVPLISGSFEGIENILDQGLQYLEWSNVLLSLQLIALSLTKSIILKGLILLTLIFVFFAKSRIIALKILLVFLMVNPGLPLYTLMIKEINTETKIDLGGELNQELKKSHADYLLKKKEQEEKLSVKKSAQFEKAEEKGKSKISLFDKVKDDVEGSVEKVEDDLGEVFNDTLDILKTAGQKIIQLCINLFTNILFLFLLLPIGYYLLLKYIISRLFISKPSTKS